MLLNRRLVALGGQSDGVMRLCELDWGALSLDERFARGVRELMRCLVAVGGLFCHRFGDHRVDRFGQLFDVLGDARRGLGEVGHGHARHVAGERCFRGQHPVQAATQ